MWVDLCGVCHPEAIERERKREREGGGGGRKHYTVLAVPKVLCGMAT